MLFQRERISGEEGSRRESSAPNQGSKPQITEKKGPKSEITYPISEPPPRSHRSDTLVMLFQAPSEGSERFTWQNKPRAFQSLPTSPQPLRNSSRNRLALTTQLSSGEGKKNHGAWEMKSS